MRTPAEPYLADWTRRSPIASMIVTGDLILIWSNPAADAMLAAAKDFHLVSGTLACVDKVRGQEFRSFLSAAGDEPEAWIYCQDEGPRQMVRAERVSAEGLQPAVALMIYRIDGVDRYLWSDFHKVFGLTKAETVVVKRLVGGEPADTIAEDLSISLETVRTHVRRVYAKLGINNREQLFSKISAFRTF